MDESFNDISQKIKKHLQERGWENQPPRGLAISIALEANELLEHYQWQEESVGDKNAVAEELADIFIYAFEFALAYDINIPEEITKKLQKAALKYPADHYEGKTASERKKAWIQDKLNHKKSGL